MFLRTAEARFFRANRKVKAEFPQRIAGRFIGKRIHLGIIVGEE